MKKFMFAAIAAMVMVSVSNVFASSRMVDNARIYRAHTYRYFFSKKVSKSHYPKKNEGYIFNTQIVLSNETSRKIAKEVSWKYHKIMEMHHKNAIKKRK